MNPTTAGPETYGEPPPRQAPERGPWYYVRKGLMAVASLRLTVVLFSLALLLIFFGTLAQIDFGIWTVVDQYFWSWVVWVPFDLFNKFLQVFWKEQFPVGSHWGGSFPFPAGKLLGLAMLINLLAAHVLQFRNLVVTALQQAKKGGALATVALAVLKRSGIYLIHGGLLLLFVGEFITREYAIEQRMTIDEGKAVNFTEDTRHVELALIDKSDPNTDRVAVIPQNMLSGARGRIAHPELPVDVEVVEYMVNSGLEDATPGKRNPADAGLGKKVIAVRQPEVSGVDPNQKVDTPALYVTLYKKGTDEKLGTYLAALRVYLLGGEDGFELDGKKHELALRFKRYYKPFSIHLDEFRFDRYVGTNKPKNYSSDVRVLDADGKEVLRTRIAMNEPLRFAGETFYQSSFDERTEKTTILQVVKNPGWWLPYLSCAVVAFGLILHFTITLVRFLRRPPGVVPAASASPGAGVVAAHSPAVRYLPWIVLAVVGLYLLSVFGRMTPPKEPYNLDAFGRIPVVDGGRVKPLDTAARVNLRMISGREEFVDENGDKQPAIRWYLDVLAGGGMQNRGPAWKHKVFRIDNEQVLRELGLPIVEGLRYSLEELGPKFSQLEARVTTAQIKEKKGQKLDLTETKLLDLYKRIGIFLKLADFDGPLLLPPGSAGQDWASLGKFRQDARQGVFAEMHAKLDMTPEQMKKMTPEEQNALMAEFDRKMAAALAQNPAAANWDRIVTAYREKQPNEFNKQVAEYRDSHLSALSDTHAGDDALERAFNAPFNTVGAIRTEVTYNRFAPFYQCTGLYVLAFVLSALGFVQHAARRPHWGEALRKSATYVLALTFVVNTLALLARMYIMERPLVFVTNLYSSAIFIGLGCVALCLVIERIFPMGVGNVLGAILGLATAIVAHNLATEDTLEMMQAVLDTNFWLATHVTTVTLGYTATFVAGFIGAWYVFQMLGAVVRDSFESREQPTVGSLLAFGFAALGLVAIPLMFLWFMTSALAKFELLHPAFLWSLFFLITAVSLMYAIGLTLARVSSEGVDAHGNPIAGQVPGLARPVVALALTPDQGKVLGQMIYGVVCFATLLSFVGTVLGGIWADQSWGRFWGWDPKENGAVLIVLWNVLILHARWAGMVKDRGMAVLAIFGNVMTAWSWFGTNQLGIGLHAYGFDTRLADGCSNFWFSQFVILLVGLIPQRYWASATRRASSAIPLKPAPQAQAAPPPAPPHPPAAPPNGQHANGQPNAQPHPRPGKKKRHGKR